MLFDLLQNGKRDSGGIIMLASLLLQRAGIVDATTENVGLVFGGLVHLIGWIHYAWKRLGDHGTLAL